MKTSKITTILAMLFTLSLFGGIHQTTMAAEKSNRQVDTQKSRSMLKDLQRELSSLEQRATNASKSTKGTKGAQKARAIPTELKSAQNSAKQLLITLERYPNEPQRARSHWQRLRNEYRHFSGNGPRDWSWCDGEDTLRRIEVIIIALEPYFDTQMQVIVIDDGRDYDRSYDNHRSRSLYGLTRYSEDLSDELYRNIKSYARHAGRGADKGRKRVKDMEGQIDTLMEYVRKNRSRAELKHRLDKVENDYERSAQYMHYFPVEIRRQFSQLGNALDEIDDMLDQRRGSYGNWNDRDRHDDRDRDYDRDRDRNDRRNRPQVWQYKGNRADYQRMQ